MSDLARLHYADLERGLRASAEHFPRLQAWGAELAERLTAGQRLLTVGNGGSAAQAQHFAAELVGRYGAERRPFSAVALHADPATLTALANDYGVEEMSARQVRAHGRAGDVLVALSTSGRSPNVVAAIQAACEIGLVAWAITGPAPNDLVDCSLDSVSFNAASPATVQELHLVAVHLLCAFVDDELRRANKGAIWA